MRDEDFTECPMAEAIERFMKGEEVHAMKDGGMGWSQLVGSWTLKTGTQAPVKFRYRKKNLVEKFGQSRYVIKNVEGELVVVNFETEWVVEASEDGPMDDLVDHLPKLVDLMGRPELLLLVYRHPKTEEIAYSRRIGVFYDTNGFLLGLLRDDVMTPDVDVLFPEACIIKRERGESDG